MRAAAYIERLLAVMKPGQRVLFDGEITEKPGSTKLINDWDQADLWIAYGAGYELLKSFAAFCQRSGGFKVS